MAGQKIYVMAHRANTKGWLDQALEWKANGIEVDISKSGGKYYSWHGDGGWEHLDTYLDHACSCLTGKSGAGVSLFIFDLKYDVGDGIKAADITAIRKSVQSRLLNPVNTKENAPDNAGLFAFYGVYKGSAYAGEFEESMKSQALLPHEGVNYDANRRVYPKTALDWKTDNGVRNFIYSSGIYVGGASPAMWKQLEKASELRKTNAFGSYGWTFGYPGSSVDTFENYGVDATLGNMDQPYGWLPTYLDHYGLKRHKLVTRKDVPPFLSKRG